MANINGSRKRDLAKSHIVGVLLGDDDGYIATNDDCIAVEELCGLLSQWSDNDLRSLIDDLASDPAHPVEFTDDEQEAVWLRNRSEGESMFTTHCNQANR